MTATLVVLTILVPICTCLAVGAAYLTSSAMSDFLNELQERDRSSLTSKSAQPLHDQRRQEVEKANFKIFTGPYSYP